MVLRTLAIIRGGTGGGTSRGRVMKEMGVGLGRAGWRGGGGAGAGAAGALRQVEKMGQRGGRGSTVRVTREGVASLRRGGRRFSPAGLFGVQGAVA